MNRKEIAEIRRRFNPEKNTITCLRGCYVNEKREVVSMFNKQLISFPQEEVEKYMSIFKRTLSGIPGKNLIDITFRPDQIMEGEEHHLLMSLRDTALNDDDIVYNLCQKIIDSFAIEGNYLILLMHDMYDVPFRAKDDTKMDDASDEVFPYIMVSVCPVKLTKPALSYSMEDNEFHNRPLDWVVAAPEVGFMFPSFDDRASNIYSALYYTRDTSNVHDEFTTAIFNTDAPMPATEQKETFQNVLSETLADECSYEVIQTVHEQIRDLIEQHDADKEAEPLVLYKNEVKNMLASCGVSEEHMEVFEEKYDEQFGENEPLRPQNIVDAKKFEVKTPDVVIHVAPEHSDLIETRTIEGTRYILIRAEEGVEVNGVAIR